MPRTETPIPPELYAEVAAATARVTWRLVVRYTPVYLALAVLLFVAAVVPSRANRPDQSAEFAGPVARTPAPGLGTVGAPSAGGGVAGDPFSGATATTSLLPGQAAATPAPGGSTGDFGAPAGSGAGGKPPDFNSGPPPCPLRFGDDPEVSRNVAGALLGAASPALSLLGPFGPNAVPALAVASPLLPVVAPVADAFSGYIRLFNPLFLQISGLATQLWDGPLAPLEGPLLELNAQYAQPFEVELLARLSPVIETANATPITPCLQRVVYNVIAPLPIPEAPRP